MTGWKLDEHIASRVIPLLAAASHIAATCSDLGSSLFIASVKRSET